MNLAALVPIPAHIDLVRKESHLAHDWFCWECEVIVNGKPEVGYIDSDGTTCDLDSLVMA